MKAMVRNLRTAVEVTSQLMVGQFVIIVKNRAIMNVNVGKNFRI